MSKNKTKQEIINEIKHTEDVKTIKKIITDIYPLISELDTIYDAQTTLGAVSGFIKADLDEKIRKIKVSEVEIDVSKEKELKIKAIIEKIVKKVKDESAQDVSETLERLARAFSDFGAIEFVKGPMDKVKLDDILAK
jgi:hypothetical protein